MIEKKSPPDGRVTYSGIFKNNSPQAKKFGVFFSLPEISTFREFPSFPEFSIFWEFNPRIS